ncbi:hypothetical protein A9179_14870 [Pseudomonas alcaligenes]|uniref:Uncharacterized protein n=2 Tax=Aquipseudomonas alcaligenes TaxID=43263 RepID=A0ABR7S492_AQUAC|nr:hypothetical protein [Pseudomonas alcaligenes]
MIGAALLLASLSAMAGAWSTQERDTFEQGCLISARDALDEGLAKQYCSCTVTGIEQSFTPPQLAALQGQQLPPELLDKLRDVSQRCQKRIAGQL